MIHLGTSEGFPGEMSRKPRRFVRLHPTEKGFTRWPSRGRAGGWAGDWRGRRERGRARRGLDRAADDTRPAGACVDHQRGCVSLPVRGSCRRMLRVHGCRHSVEQKRPGGEERVPYAPWFQSSHDGMILSGRGTL